MPSVEQNLWCWDQHYSWPAGGEEWSQWWGGAKAQWFFLIYPRIQHFLPVGTLLEIAPGHGRWTDYLKDHCRQLVGIDVSPTCVEVCKRRFEAVPHASFQVNDGYSLAMVPDGSVDFAFSFDSLVHADWDVMAAYIGELARKLTPAGVAFLHHSHVGAYRDRQTGQLPANIQNGHWRSTNVSAPEVAQECERVGLKCVSQEVVKWGADYFNDCFSVVARAGSPWSRETFLVENADFMKQASHIAWLAQLLRGGESGEDIRPTAEGRAEQEELP
jgi:hypothetical protein